MAKMTAKEAELRLRFRDNFEDYAAACLKIRTKSGDVAPLLLNRSQLYLHDRLEEQRKEKGRVRALVLKGRQVGISTYVGGRYYWRGTHRRGLRTFILAHLDTASDNLFGIAKRYHDNCPDAFRPQTGTSNAKELSFSALDGGYKVATAGSKSVGRSETIQLFHGSELGFWPNAEEHFAGIIQALAKTDDSECILESTANGIGNVFHTLWKAAERGESEFEAVFIPWFLHEEYATEPPEDWRAPTKFAEYGDLYSLTAAQLYWAWSENRTLAQATSGTIDEPCWKFRQEYPANAEEAFSSSGDESFIPVLAVLKARKAENIRPFGPVIIGVDPARGGKDKTAIIDRQGRVMGCNVYKKLDYGHDTMPISGEVVRLYRNLTGRGESVFVVFDVTGLGGPLYDRVKEILPPGRVYGVNFAQQALDPNRYANCRAEIWSHMANWFQDPAGVKCPDLDELQGDICAPIRGKGATRFDSAGRLILESKDHINERLNFSPDIGDAAALTFAVDMGVLLEREDDDDDDDGQSYAHFTRSDITGY
jgi:hypothetical protein